jgi:hypothetical protein
MTLSLLTPKLEKKGCSTLDLIRPQDMINAKVATFLMPCATTFRYGGIPKAETALGNLDQISKMFSDF